ncbi:hypothetical protein [Gillisia hiemivivida]|uniref:Uncharacterized protein n=1 Tax=Gillisia hiemivivida TaxID=291190 RepID=A0A5C6ZXA0_9FLAO|nr:hypothetical protein [Gillisia hiemivivida]TXD94912.1 hypothetical protein ES724_05440 [Gillisia hiemivivida]
MLEITKTFKSEIVDSFQFIDNGDTIHVDSEINHVEPKNYDLEPDEVKVIVNEILLSTELEIHFSIVFNKYNVDAERDIISQIENQYQKADVSYLEQSKSGDTRKVSYAFIL